MHDVLGVEAGRVGETLRQTEHHVGGVGGFADLHPVAAAAEHLRDHAETPLDLLGGEEVGRRAQSLADGEAEQRAAKAIAQHGGLQAQRHQASRSRASRSKKSAW